VNNLENLYNFGFGTGKQANAAGNSSLGAAGSYWNSLLSGNRAATSAAIAPETNQINSAADASRRQQAATGTARGGGVAGANQQQQTNTQAQVDNAIFAVRPQAAQQTAQIGGQELNEAQGLFGTSASAAGAAGNIATQARQESASEQQSIIGDVFGFLPKSLGLNG
jgi:hypothetical protein